MKYKACVIGCGEIGSEVLKDLSAKLGPDDVCGVDLSNANNNILSWYGKMFFPSQMPDAEVYIITLWTMESIKSTLQILQKKTPKLIFIESTIDPQTVMDIELSADVHFSKLVWFPHRWNPNDPEHAIYNQDRVLGTEQPETEMEAVKWLTSIGMNPNMIHCTDTITAVWSKVVENTYRAWEIVLAQEMKKSLDWIGVNFQEVRKAANTKWNIDIREVHSGVKGKCLPKDLGFFNKVCRENMASNMLEMLNEKYIKEHSA